MYDLDKAYSPKFFKQRISLNWRAEIMVDAVMSVIEGKHKHFKIGSVVDVGCGNGDILREFSTRGMTILGIEGTANAEQGMLIGRDDLLIWDLRYKLNRDHVCLIDRFNVSHKNKFDLALCLEVAEHIEDEYATTFIKNLTSLSDTIIFSAAPPGQGGRYHVNCQHYEYWFYKFNAQGFRENKCLTNKLFLELQPWAYKKGIKAFHTNSTVWERWK